MKSLEISVGSAITLLNAIYADHGSAAGIDVQNSIRIKPADKLKFTTHPKQDTELIRHCVNLIEKMLDHKITNVEISTHSILPPARGLKTSSAISTGIIKGLSDFYSLNMMTSQIVNLSAQASINAKVSITGAYDDAYASYSGGLVLTDTRLKSLVLQTNISINKLFFLLIPKQSKAKSTIVKEERRMPISIETEIIDLLKTGKIEEATKLNTGFYAPILLPNPEIITEICKISNDIIGINGTGPSLFVFCSSKNENSFRRSINESFPEYQLMKTSLKQIYR